jgi:hypothetical protein
MMVTEGALALATSREDELRACGRRAEELRYPRRVRIAIRTALTLVASVSNTNAADGDEVRLVIREALDAFAAHELRRAR